MTDIEPVDESEQRWQQPGFVPPTSPDATAESSGLEVIPAAPHPVAVPPPSVLESTLKVLSGLPWVVMIGFALLGIGNWMLNIVIAIVASGLLGGIVAELDRRRKARAEFEASHRREELR